MSQEYNVQQVLVFVMVVTAIADRKVDDRELFIIREIIYTLPIFKGYANQLDNDIASCLELLADEEGINKILQLVKASLPKKFYEIAYLLACEVIAADDKAAQEELRWLNMLQNHLELDFLHASAIQYSTRIRYRYD